MDKKQQDQYLMPTNSPLYIGSLPAKMTPWQFGAYQKIKGKSMIMDKPFMQYGTYNYPNMGTVNANGGTWSNAVMQTMIALDATLGTVIDSLGLVSTTNFATDHVEDLTTHTTTSTTPVDVPGSSLTAFVLDRAANAVIYVTGFGYNLRWLNGAGDVMQLQCLDSIDGTLLNFPLYLNQALTSVSGTGSPFTSFGYNVDYQFNSHALLVNLSAGTHTLKLQYYVSAAGTATLATYQLGYTILGL